MAQTAHKSSASLWNTLWQEAVRTCEQEAPLAPLIENTITCSRNIQEATSRLLIDRLAHPHLTAETLMPIFETFISISGPALNEAISSDLDSVIRNDPAAKDVLTPFMFYKGFHALQAHRLAHYLWNTRKHHIACFIQSRVASRFGVDIHPAAKIGKGVMMDHATGIVVGETAVIEDDVLMWHGVTLGGRGTSDGDRHPKVRAGAIIGANATILGNIEIGAGAKIAAGSTVIESVPPGVTVAGIPAKQI